jgi:hypothetical protein
MKKTYTLQEYNPHNPEEFNDDRFVIVDQDGFDARGEHMNFAEATEAWESMNANQYDYTDADRALIFMHVCSLLPADQLTVEGVNRMVELIMDLHAEKDEARSILDDVEFLRETISLNITTDNDLCDDPFDARNLNKY